MGKKSKDKGNRGENIIIKKLQDVFGGSFIRVAGSGGHIGGKNAIKKQYLSEEQKLLLKGDIVPPSFMPRFVIESKFYEDFSFHHLLKDKQIPKLEEWIEQTDETVDEDDFAVIIMRINYKGSYIFFQAKYKDQLSYKNHAVYTDKKDRKWIVTDLDYFLDSNKEKILELTK